MSKHSKTTMREMSCALVVCYGLMACSAQDDSDPQAQAFAPDGATPTADPDGNGTGDASPPGTDGASADGSLDAGESDLERCAIIKASITEAGFGSEVTVTCDGQHAYLASDTYPDHHVMNGITGTNEQVPVPAKDYVSPVPLSPRPAATVTTIDAALGVAVNGVPIYDYSSQGELDVTQYDPKADTLLTGQLDLCGGHAGRGDDYHYHAAPTCMIEAMQNRGPAAIIGWAFDGYPIYGNDNPDGSAIAEGTLDDCNGQPDARFGYRYHTSDAPPYITQCLVGEVDSSMLPRVAPLANMAGGGKAPGMPPQGGVEDLRFTTAADGTRRMEYRYQGKTYYIEYKPSTTADCYDFESSTVTSGGSTDVATYCRGDKKP